MTGSEAQARAEVGEDQASDRAHVASVHKPSRPVTYYYELNETYYSAGSSTFIGQLLGLLGLRSIADAAKGTAANGGYPQLSGEFVLKANPDYILLADTICCGQSVATVAARPGWSGLAAVKSGRVLGLNDDVALTMGTARGGPALASGGRAASASVVTATAPARTPDGGARRARPGCAAHLGPDGRGGRAHGGRLARSRCAPGRWPISAQVLGTLSAHVRCCTSTRSTPAIDQAIVWQLRAPRVVLAGIVGAMGIGGRRRCIPGGLPQPAGRPLPSGRRRGAGPRGNTGDRVRRDSSAFLPVVAFVGGSVAVACHLPIGVTGGHHLAAFHRAGRRRRGGAADRHPDVSPAARPRADPPDLQLDPRELLPGIWSDVTLILPYVVVSGAVLLAHRRMLDVLRVGEDEARTLGIHPRATGTSWWPSRHPRHGRRRRR